MGPRRGQKSRDLTERMDSNTMPSDPRPSTRFRTLVLGIAVLAAATLPFALELSLVFAIDPLFFVSPNEALACGFIILLAALVALIVRRRRSPIERIALAAALDFGFIATVHTMLWFAPSRGELSLAGLIALLSIAVGCGVIAFTQWLGIRLLPSRRFGLGCGLALLGLVYYAGSKQWPSDGVSSRSNRLRGKGTPDIVLLILDTTRFDHLSMNGYFRPTTPNLDRFAEDARIYDRAWSAAPWTVPAHASIFMGMLPAEHGIENGALSTSGETIAERLRNGGYATFGAVNNPHLAESLGWARGYQMYRQTWIRPLFSIAALFAGARRAEAEWRWRGDTPTTLEWVERWWITHSEKPRFVMVNLMDPHAPYGDSEPSLFFDEKTRTAPDISFFSEDYDSGHLKAEGAALDRVIARYDADLHTMDRSLGAFFEWLKDRGELDKSAILVTADHGERLGERGLLGHQLGLDECLLRVPMIVRYLPGFTPGHVSKNVETNGIYETIADLAGLDSGARAHHPALELQDDDLVFAQMRHQQRYLDLFKEHYPEFDPSPFDGDWMTACDGRWKLLESSKGVLRLYDVVNDHAEGTDVKDAHPEIVARLRKAIESLPRFKANDSDEAMPVQVEELLNGIGYFVKHEHGRPRRDR